MSTSVPDRLGATLTASDATARPTEKTRRAGVMALLSAGAFLTAGALYALLVVTDGDQDFAWVVYMALTGLGLVASFLGLFAMIGVSRRLGGLGALGVIGLAIIGLGAAASIVAWALPLWMALQGIGYAIVGGSVLRRGIAPPRSTVLVSFGFLIGSTVFLLLSFAEVGWRDSYGDYPLAWVIGGVVGIVLISSGLVGLAKWLRSE